MKISQKQVKAFSYICEDSGRQYSKLVSYDSEVNRLVASNGRALLSLTPVLPIEAEEKLPSKSYFFSAVKVEAQIAKLGKLDLLGLQKLELEYGLPPYSGAIPPRPQKVASFDIKTLISLLEALKHASSEKNPVVEFYVQDHNDYERPLMLKIAKSEDFGLLVPLKDKG
jgi:hypothetical protein